MIDMKKHQGEHPRMGATDVCPFVPVASVSMEDCVKIAEALGKRVAEEFRIPVYLYEEAAREEKRKNLANIRKGEYEGLQKKIRDPEWKPDFGEPVFNEKSGATVIGAREFLIAYNVNLNTKDSKLANMIAKNVRESGKPKRDDDGNIVKDENGEIVRIPGKLKAVRGIGWYVDEYGCAQVSINLTNYHITPLHIVFEEVRKEARKLGLGVTGSELVGLIPEEALIEAGKFYLKKQGISMGVPKREIIHTAVKSLGLSDVTKFNPEEKVIEYRINKESDRLVDYTLLEFAEELSSNSPAPGGGSVAAIAGALSAALTAMVGNLTYGKKKYQNNWDKAEEISEKAQDLKQELLSLACEDTKAFNQLMKSFRMKKETEEQKQKRREAIREATKLATEIPLTVMEKSLTIMELALKIAKIGNLNAISDAGVAGEMALASCRSASLNVKINIPSLKDEKFARDAGIKQDDILKRIESLYIKLTSIVEEKL